MRRMRFLLEKRATEEQMKRLKAAGLVSFLPMEAVSETGELDLSREKPQEEVSTGYTQFFDGDVLVARITPCFENGKGAVAQGLKNGIGYGSTEFHVLRPTKELSPNFLYYITQSSNFRKLGEASMTGAAGQKRVTDEFIQNFEVEIPEPDVQRRICEYLGKALTDLRELISAKQSLLETLAEKRRALITHAVTQGLDPNAPMRDSGIPWLGKIPAHWKVLDLRRVVWSLEQGWSPVASNQPAGENSQGVLKLSAVKQGRFIAEENKELLVGDTIPAGLGICDGDIFITRANTPKLVGDVAKAESDYPWLTFSDLIYRVRAIPEMIAADFLVYALLSEPGRSAIESEAKGSSGSMVKLAQDQILGLPVAVPPVQEQYRIVKWLSKEIEKIQRLNDATQRTTALLHERRTALISAAVTGQLEVAA